MIKTFKSTVSFFCFNEPENNLIEVRQKLDEIIRQLIYLNNTREFLFTGENIIDRMAHEIVSQYAITIKDIKRVYCSTRQWWDTTCNFDKENFNNMFERKVPINVSKYKDRQKQLEHSNKVIIDWSNFVVFYSRIDNNLTFINYKEKLLKNNTYLYLMKRRPKSAINLIDYDIEEFAKAIKILNIKHKSKNPDVVNKVIKKKEYYAFGYKYQRKDCNNLKRKLKNIRLNNEIDEDKILKFKNIGYVNKDIEKEKFLKQVEYYKNLETSDQIKHINDYKNYRLMRNEKYTEFKKNKQNIYFENINQNNDNN